MGATCTIHTNRKKLFYSEPPPPPKKKKKKKKKNLAYGPPKNSGEGSRARPSWLSCLPVPVLFSEFN